MKRLWTVVIFGIAAIGYQRTAVAAEKAAAASSDSVVFGPFGSALFNGGSVIVTPFQDVVASSISPPGGKDLLINVSMETGIFLTTELNFSPTSPFTFTAAQTGSSLVVKVLIDCSDCPRPYAGQAAEPGLVAFDTQTRLVSQRSVSFDEESFSATDQQGIAFLLGVRSFTFIARDVQPGTHTIRVQAQFAASNFSSSVDGFAASSIRAHIGTRTLTIEQVKLDAR
jgi:hypothetical protein